MLNTYITGDGAKHATLSDATDHAARVQKDTGAIIAVEALPTTGAPTTEGERSLYRWQYRQASDFEHHLWNAICAADSTNLEALARAFPLHVEAYRRYATELGYWTSLKERIESE